MGLLEGNEIFIEFVQHEHEVGKDVPRPWVGQSVLSLSLLSL